MLRESEHFSRKYSDYEEILQTIYLQLDNVKEYLEEKSILKIGTLGPKGTTSYYATQYFIQYIKKYNKNIGIEVILEDRFDIVTQDLLDKKVDLIIVPNAYERITDMYWNPKLNNLFTFLLETPKYAIAGRVGDDIRKRNKYKLATCSPVVCLADYFMEELDIPKEAYEIIRANSTTRAAEMVENEVADMAITNATSIKDKNLEFISSNHNTAMVKWGHNSLRYAKTWSDLSNIAECNVFYYRSGSSTPNKIENKKVVLASWDGINNSVILASNNIDLILSPLYPNSSSFMKSGWKWIKTEKNNNVYEINIETSTKKYIYSRCIKVLVN